MEKATSIGILLGLFAVFGGAFFEGVQFGTLLQFTAAFIVFGGTLGAILVSCPFQDVKLAFRLAKAVFQNSKQGPQKTITEIVEVASLARKEGLVSLDSLREKLSNRFFSKSLRFILDGFEAPALKEIMDTEIAVDQEKKEAAARVWELAGSYAPTVGVIGAVLGLINVLSKLEDPSKIGQGIAIAFVATVYGLASANLVFIPLSARIKRLSGDEAKEKEIVKTGVLAIQEGLNPLFLKEKLEIFLENNTK